MAQATEYNRQANFRDLQTLSPASPTPGNKLDDEFNAIKLTTDELRARNARIQRDDGQLANQSVGKDQLRTEVQVGLNTPRVWRPNFEFLARDTTLVGDKFYICLVGHVSSTTFAADLAALRWEMLADFSLYSQQVLEAGAAAMAAVAAVEDAADRALASELDAEAARDSASGHRLTAQNAAGTAIAARDGAIAARDGAIAARDVAQTARDTAVSTVNAATQLGTPADGTVTEPKLATEAVSTAKLAVKAVTLAKMADLASPGLIGRATAGAGAIEVLTGAQGRALLGVTRETIGSGSLAGGSLAEMLFPATDYRRIEWLIDGAQLSVNAQVALQLQFGGAWATTGYAYFGTFQGAGEGAFSPASSLSAPSIPLSQPLISDALAAARFTAEILITAPATSGIKAVRFSTTGVRASDSAFVVADGAGENPGGTAAITGARLLTSAGQFSAGRYEAIGVL